MHGITGYGAYIPRLRLQRSAIVAANAWGNRALKAHGKGERSMCNWDEDSVTMAVAAARDCFGGDAAVDGGGGAVENGGAPLSSIVLASTSLPFADRQNAGIVANALMLPPNVRSMDVTASQKAGTSALASALDMVRGVGNAVLMVAADKRRAKPASAQELLFGDGAAALTLASEAQGAAPVIARLLGGASRTVDFVDHHRGEDRVYDYHWEERWIRDEGYMKIVPPTLAEVLESTGTAPEAVGFFAMPCVFPAVPRNIAKAIGLPAGSVRGNLFEACGETGVAHPLMLLIEALQEARPGDKVLVAGFGQGCDALLFEATEHLPAYQSRTKERGVKGALAARREETNYHKFLTFNHEVNKEMGIRAEADIPTPLSALYRNKDMVHALMGGLCTACGTAQFPKTRVCVSPECKATDTQQDYSFANRPARIMTWTADHLTSTLDPPGYYGMVEFSAEDGSKIKGGRFMADFTDVDPALVEVGAPVTMVFRIKQFDERRGFRRYFWKAVPGG